MKPLSVYLNHHQQEVIQDAVDCAKIVRVIIFFFRIRESPLVFSLQNLSFTKVVKGTWLLWLFVLLSKIFKRWRFSLSLFLFTKQALERYEIEKDIAAYIKKEFDKKYQPTWHCVVGRNFGSYVTHETGHFIYFYIGHIAILLFRSGWGDTKRVAQKEKDRACVVVRGATRRM